MCKFVKKAVKAVGDFIDDKKDDLQNTIAGPKPKADPTLLAAAKAEFERQKQEQSMQKDDLFKTRKQQSSEAGVRSLITGSRAGYGRGLTY